MSVGDKGEEHMPRNLSQLFKHVENGVGWPAKVTESRLTDQTRIENLDHPASPQNQPHIEDHGLLGVPVVELLQDECTCQHLDVDAQQEHSFVQLHEQHHEHAGLHRHYHCPLNQCTAEILKGYVALDLGVVVDLGQLHMEYQSSYHNIHQQLIKF